MPSSPHIQYGTRLSCFWPILPRTTLVIPKPLPAVLTTKVLRICTHRFRWTTVPLLMALLSPLSFSKSKIIPPTDSEYVFALGAANDFLHAWQTQDREAGFLLLTDRLKQRSSEDALVDFFSRKACRGQSFEIARGKKLAPGRYRFPI